MLFVVLIGLNRFKYELLALKGVDKDCPLKLLSS